MPVVSILHKGAAGAPQPQNGSGINRIYYIVYCLNKHSKQQIFTWYFYREGKVDCRSSPGPLQINHYDWNSTRDYSHASGPLHSAGKVTSSSPEIEEMAA